LRKSDDCRKSRKKKRADDGMAIVNTLKNHDKLMDLLYKKVPDARILRLIRKYLNAGIMLNGCCVTSEEGAPQGGPLSPLL
jgi:O-acetylhomoserine/O-acetylserine sulfhydrylase-like pyridoxal-dependent enzyme